MPPTLSLRRIAPCPNNFIQRPGSLSSDARCVCLSNIGSDKIDSPGDMIPGLRARAAVQSSSRARRLGAPRGAVDQSVASVSSRCVMPNCRRRLDCARVGTLFPDVLPKNGTAAALPSFQIDRSVQRRARCTSFTSATCRLCLRIGKTIAMDAISTPRRQGWPAHFSP